MTQGKNARRPVEKSTLRGACENKRPGAATPFGDGRAAAGLHFATWK
jgi:hypothetical protein